MKSPASFLCFIIIRGELKSCWWTHRRLSCQVVPYNPLLRTASSPTRYEHTWTWGLINAYLTACSCHVRTEIKRFEITTPNAHAIFLTTLFDLVSILLYIPDNRQITSTVPIFGSSVWDWLYEPWLVTMSKQRWRHMLWCSGVLTQCFLGGGSKISENMLFQSSV